MSGSSIFLVLIYALFIALEVPRHLVSLLSTLSYIGIKENEKADCFAKIQF